MKRTVLTLTATAAVGLCLGAAALADGLKPGFDVEQARQRLGRPATLAACPAAPAPVVDMGGMVSRYDPKDPSQSHVDPRRDAISKAQEAGLTAFARQLDLLADRALLANPPDPAFAACIVSQLATWARADALGGNLDANNRVGRDQAVMEQAWYGAAFASALAKAGGFAAVVPGPNAVAVKGWLRELASSVMWTFAVLGPLHPANNHRYWAGYAVASTGVLLHDRTMLAFGRRALHDGLSAVAADGSLPAEMARGPRALTYQFFATLPLAGLVALADRNDAPLGDGEEAALDRLVAFDLSAAADPAAVEALAHARQEPAVTGFALGWIDVLTAHLSRRNPSLAAAMDKVASRPGMRPAWFIFLGGDVTAAYNPGATVTKAP